MSTWLRFALVKRESSCFNLIRGKANPLFEPPVPGFALVRVNRERSFNPEASSGGRPSSVRALRKAKQ
ncbi:MAG: hypothetical protein KME05_20515 [Gloeocapsa sp. UFS-A4-WI-NPMV-4B04]|nr:hypothetical protein [Gloeocapsa sp. UFS-A4-WI-NPMV-4B04]